MTQPVEGGESFRCIRTNGEILPRLSGQLHSTCAQLIFLVHPHHCVAMSVLPPTYLVALILVFILVRLRRILGLPSLLLDGVAFYMPPTAAVLDSLNTPEVAKAKHQKPQKTVGERLQAMQLTMSPITTHAMTKCLFFDLYDTLVTATVSSVVVFAYMQVLPASTPDPSYYLLLVSLVLSLGFPFFIQYGISSSYEKQLGFGVAVLGTIVALFSLYAPPSLQLLDFDVEGAAASMDGRWQVLLGAMGMPSTSSAWKTHWLMCLLAVLAGLVSSATLLPALRFAKMYSDFIASKAISPSWKIVLHLNMLLPVVLTWAWLRPVASSLLLGDDAVICPTSDTSSFSWIAPRDCGDRRLSWLSESTFRNLRVHVLVAAALVRLACYRSHLQYFLLEPKHKVTAQLLLQGRVDTQAITDTIVGPFRNLPVICVQYLAPVGLWLSAALLFQRKAGHCLYWMDILAQVGNPIPPSLLCAAQVTDLLPTTPLFAFEHSQVLGWPEFEALLHGLREFPLAEPLWYQSVLGFVVWWSALSWCVLSAVGLVYWRQAAGLQRPWIKAKTH
ncbi:hypothetical protein DYB35_013752 [Aphanomyces astaci]|uniref:Uncharacterized protein n=1 Tax=Aphanomyces astaci TaxID=112090 RepID=A0A418CV95_APHAT|nr:hypothetical protein DYB35_013752 [Aphanomyces astaci]